MRKEIPILFSTAMVQAILEGRKTETRRQVKPQPQPIATEVVASDQWKGKDFVARFPYDREPVVYEVTNLYKCPYGQPGDVLWVRESFRYTNTPNPEVLNYQYKDGAKGAEIPEDECYKISDYDRLRPSIHMPKAAARIWLEVVEVKVERLQDITEDGAKAEGVKSDPHIEELVAKGENIAGSYYFYPCKDYRDGDWGFSAKTSFYSLWQSINGLESWTANPWVWVIKFKVLSTTGKPQHLCTQD